MRQQTIIEGSDFTLAAASADEQARLSPVDGSAALDGVFDVDVLRFASPAPGRYWLHTRAEATDAWSPMGQVLVAWLVDPVEAKLRRELAALSQRIERGEGVVHTVADGGSDTSASTIQLPTLIRQREYARSRLGEYLARRGGGGAAEVNRL